MDEKTKCECVSEVAQIRAELEEVYATIDFRGKSLSPKLVNLKNKVEKLFSRIEKAEQKLAA